MNPKKRKSKPRAICPIMQTTEQIQSDNSQEAFEEAMNKIAKKKRKSG